MNGKLKGFFYSTIDIIDELAHCFSNQKIYHRTLLVIYFCMTKVKYTLSYEYMSKFGRNQSLEVQYYALNNKSNTPVSAGSTHLVHSIFQHQAQLDAFI